MKKANLTCLFPGGLEDPDLQEEATAQHCGHRELHHYCYIHRQHTKSTKKYSLTDPKVSFWLRVRQVSGKQAMFPRIPTQISLRGKRRNLWAVIGKSPKNEIHPNVFWNTKYRNYKAFYSLWGADNEIWISLRLRSLLLWTPAGNQRHPTDSW